MAWLGSAVQSKIQEDQHIGSTLLGYYAEATGMVFQS